jgi:hypothetical protein
VIRVGWLSHRRRYHPGLVHEPLLDAEVLCEEASAYLGGRSAELFAARREPVPSWAFLNAPTHRSAAEVRDLADQVAVDSRPGQRWDVLPAVIAAAMLLRSSRTASTVPQLQIDRLLPLEQALINGDVRVRTPSELLHIAVLALHTGRWHCHT